MGLGRDTICTHDSFSEATLAPASRYSSPFAAVLLAGLAGAGIVLIVSVARPRLREDPSSAEADDPLIGIDAPDYRQWDEIIIHHSATDSGNAERFDRWHREGRGWDDGLGYHFVIGNGRGSPDGKVEVGHRWRRQHIGAHARGHNARGIGICLVGNFEQYPPTPAQLKSLGVLLDRLGRRFGIAEEAIKAHRDVGNTKCPGRHLSRSAILQALHEARRSRAEPPDRTVIPPAGP
jgi:N-acetylmuramoyl-L-alanine amidase